MQKYNVGLTEPVFNKDNFHWVDSGEYFINQVQICNSLDQDTEAYFTFHNSYNEFYEWFQYKSFPKTVEKKFSMCTSVAESNTQHMISTIQFMHQFKKR